MKCRVPSHRNFHQEYGSILETHEVAMMCFICGESWHETIEPQPLTEREAGLANIMSPEAEKWLYGAIMSVLGQLPDDILIRMSEVVNDMREQEFKLMEKEKTA